MPQKDLTTSVGLADLSDWRLARGLKTLTVEFVVAGSNGFVIPPAPSAAPRFDGCQIIVFDKKSDDALAKTFRRILDRSRRADDKHNDTAKFELDGLTYFMSLPKPHVMLLATDKQYMAKVAERIESEPAEQETVFKYPEWKYVCSDSMYWAVRRVAKSSSKEAISLVFQYSPSNPNDLKIRYRTQATQSTVAALWAADKSPSPKVCAIDSNVFEVSQEVQTARSFRVFNLQLLLHLGHPTPNF